MLTESPSSIQVTEVVGVFGVAGSLHAAVEELQNSGFTDEDMGLLADDRIFRHSLSDLSENTKSDLQAPETSNTAFARQVPDKTGPQSFSKAFYFAGSTGAFGAVLASAAFLGGGPIVLATLAVSGGVLGVLGSRAVMAETEAEYLQKHLGHGHLILLVRTNGSATQQRVMKVMERHSALDVRVYEQAE